MNVTIFYFSGTGNTWWVSYKLKEELEKLRATVKVYSLENPALKEDELTTKLILNSEQIVIGFPVYASDIPNNIKTFIEKLPTVHDNKKFCAFCTQAGFSGDATYFFKKEIENKGYKFLQNFYINITTNFNVAMFPFSLSKPAEGIKLENKKRKAIDKLKRIAVKISRGEYYSDGKSVHQLILGKIQRYYFRKHKKKMPDYFKFFEDRCSKCKMCIKNCPTNNLSFESEMLKWGSNCLLCFRCYNFCPTLAINYGKKVSKPEKYKRFKGPVKVLKISNIKDIEEHNYFRKLQQKFLE